MSTVARFLPALLIVYLLAVVLSVKGFGGILFGAISVLGSVLASRMGPRDEHVYWGALAGSLIFLFLGYFDLLPHRVFFIAPFLFLISYLVSRLSKRIYEMYSQE